MVYRTKGTCSQAINVEAENGIVTKVQFVGGCAGNTARYCKTGSRHESGRRHQQTGRHHLRPAPTSCPDQLAKALKQLKAEQQ